MTLATGSRPGFTLVEVMLSVSILAIGLVAVLGGYASLINGLEIAEANIDALCLLKDKLAEIEQDNLKVLNASSESTTGGFKGQQGQDFSWASEVRILDKSELGIESLFEQEEEEPKDYLSQVKLRVGKVAVYSYFDGYYDTE